MDKNNAAEGFSVDFLRYDCNGSGTRIPSIFVPHSASKHCLNECPGTIAARNLLRLLGS